MKKLLIILLAVVTLLVALALSGWWWLTTTQSGAGWALNRAAGVFPSLRWERLEGGLRDGLVVHGLQLEEADLSVTVERLELAVRVHLPPSPKVDVHWLRLINTDIQLPPAEDPPDPREPLDLPALSSPIEVHLREVLVQTLTLRLPDPAADPVIIERAALTGRYFQELELESLELAMADLDASASGRWGLQDPFAGQLDLAASYRIQPDLVQDLQAGISGDLNNLLIELETRGPIAQSGRIELNQALADAAFRVDLDGRVGDWPDLALAVEDLAIEGQGRLDDWQIELSGRAVGADIPENRWRFEMAGNLERIQIQSGSVDIFDGRIDLNGAVALGAPPRGNLVVELDGLDLSALYPEWPLQARLNGRFDLDASPEALIVDNLALSAPPTPMLVQGQGRWSPETDELALQLDWNDLNWPPVLDDSEPLLRSETGSIQLSGQLSDWQMELDALLQMIGQPEVRLEAAARGSQSSADISRLTLDAGPAGTLQASGQLLLEPTPSAEIELLLERFDIGQFTDAISGEVNADVSLSASSLSDLRLDLRRLDGVLLDQSLSGTGQLDLRGETPAGGTLNLDLGDNQVRLTSDDGNIWELQLAAHALQQLVPEAVGRLNADARIDVALGLLELSAQLSSAAWGEITLDQANLEAELSWLEELPGGNLQLNLNDLDLNPWERVDQLALVIEGNCRRHTARLNLAGQRGSVNLGAHGALNTCILEDFSAWSGAIDELFIGNTLAGDWELNRPLEIELAEGRASASDGCLVEAAERRGRICLRRLEVAESGRAEIGIEQVPMDLLLIPLDPVFNLTTPLSGELEAGWSDSAGLEHVAGFLELGPGALKPLGSDDTLLGLEAIRLDLIPESDHLRITLDALLEGDSRLIGQAQLVDLNNPASATIDARANLNLPDIGVFNRLITELDQLGGRLSGEMQVSGALLGPSLDGQLRLDDGVVFHAPLGLRIEDISLALDGTQERARLQGQMRGGDGQMNLDGELELVDEQWLLEASVTGNDFRFADVNWLRLRASPEIRVQRSGSGLITLDGDIRINHLRAGMPPGTEQRINASADVRVRGETLEADDQSDLAERVQGRLGLDMGDDARLAAIGMQAQLAGGLELLWDRQNVEPRARGVIRIPEGSYRAYGQNLAISDGEVIFTGHAIDNPSLNIEAIREIFGDPQVEAAGVRIRGNAQDPRISLFTEPPTSEEKALAYVVTGANFDHGAGQAAINVGFYLLPRLFVSYGIGLFEAGNVLSGRYELSRRWGVRVVSGERDTGVDLSFAIDR